MTELLTLPNVKVSVGTADLPQVLEIRHNTFSHTAGTYQFPIVFREENMAGLGGSSSQTYEEQKLYEKKVQSALSKRDWRLLRERLINLDFSDAETLAIWLKDAGYAPRKNQLEWMPEDVTKEVSEWLRSHRDIIAWMMGLDLKQFHKAIAAAYKYFEDQGDVSAAHMEARHEGRPLQRIRPPEKDFLAWVNSPRGLNTKLLEGYLRGIGVEPKMLADFSWDRRGNPFVKVRTNCPLEAISMSVHVDRNFSKRQWAYCAICGKGFEQGRSNERFCGKTCKNYAAQTTRRQKIKLLQLAQEAWEKESANSRKGSVRLNWIVEWVNQNSTEEFHIDPAWAKKQLAALRP